MNIKGLFKKISSGHADTPTVLQMEAVECGAASLGMILAYHGLKVPLEVLRVECGVSRDGSKASNMLKAARKYGLEAKGYKKEPKDLMSMKMPVIIFWNFNHFVVLEGFKKGKALINDPASGKRTVSMEDFDSSFTGIVLTFDVTPAFEKGGVSDSIYFALAKRFSTAGSALTFVILAGLFLVIPGLVVPAFSRVFIDNILVGQMTGWLKPLLIGMAVTTLIQGGLTWLQEHYLLRFETKLAVSSTAKFVTHIFKLPIEFFSQRMPGEIVSRIQLNDAVASLLSGELAVNALNAVMVVFYAVVMMYYDVTLTLVGIFIAVLNIAALKLVSAKRIAVNQKFQMEAGKLMGVSMSGLSMIEPLKASGGESDFFAKWAGQQAKVINAQQELAAPSQMLMVITPFLIKMTTVAILLIGGLKVMHGEMTMGMLIAFQGLMNSFINPFNELVGMGSLLQQTVSDVKRLDDAMNHKHSDRFLVNDERDSRIDKLRGVLEMQNVSFGYSRLEPPLITDFSLKVYKGRKIAIVGGSGSGKSTVAKIASGLYTQWDGKVLYDGIEIGRISDSALFNSAAMVSQEIFIFEGTVKENIAMWDATIPDADILRAAKDACIHDDIAVRPGGYKSRVEEGGGNFSGGQRQRIEIARALVKNPSVLILDEATSALDAQTEKTVVENINRRGITCLIVAHRLSTIRDCDEIIVLSGGKIVQRGTHEEMKNQEDMPYAELIKSY